MPSVTSPELLRGLYRVQAFERAGGREAKPHEIVGPAAVALALRGSPRPDVLTLRSGATGAALLRGLSARDLARYLAADLRPGMFEHDVPGLGHGGHGHPTFHSLGLIAPIPTPGASVTVSAGAALSFRLRNENRVAVVVEEANCAASGGWHEGLNLAAAQNAPLVVILLHDDRRSRRPAVSQRGAAYGVRAERLTADSVGSLAHGIGRIIAEVRHEPATCLLEIDHLPDNSITEMEARLVQGGGNRSQVELDDLAVWSAKAEREAKEAWAGLERHSSQGAAA